MLVAASLARCCLSVTCWPRRPGQETNDAGFDDAAGTDAAEVM